MKKIYVLLIFIIVAFVMYRIIQSNQLTPKYQQSKVEHAISGALAKKHNLTFIGGAQWSKKYGLKIFDFDFEKKGPPLSIDEYRLIIVDCVEEALSIINADRELLPYLCDYPCSENNIGISIFFRDSNGARIVLPNLSWLAHYGKRISYNYNDSHVPYELRNNPEESYQEALKIYKQHQAGLLRPNHDQ